MEDTAVKSSEKCEPTSEDLKCEDMKSEEAEKLEIKSVDKVAEVFDTNQEESESNKPKTNVDLQRAIEGLKEIPDKELQEFLDDEDFMEDLDVVDAWEGEEDKRPQKKSRSRSRTKEKEKEKEKEKGKEKEKERDKKRSSRDRNRCRDHRSPNNREKLRRDDRRREENRRDPSKSTKDIERDKIRIQRDSESKILAEKKKAIKTLLDSDNVVPPGTEMEAIETIAQKQSNDKPTSSRNRRSRDRRRSAERHRGSPNRRRSADRGRRSPHRRWSPIVISPERRRSPIKLSPSSRRSSLRLSPSILSPESRRSLLRLSPAHPRRLSWERRISADERRRSTERHERRRHEREHRPSGRRSRSRERHRSRSTDRHRRRYSRSPGDRRGSPRWRSRSGSRGRSPQRRTRKRSPFINEIRRQFRNETTRQPMPPTNPAYAGPLLMGGMPPIYSHDQEHQPYILHHQPGPQGMMMPSMPQGFMNFDPVHQHMPPMNYDPSAAQTLMQSEFSSGAVIYSQQNTAPVRPQLLPQPVPSPQPVPAPGQMIDQGPMIYNQAHCGPPLLPTLAQQLPETNDRRSSTPQANSGRSNTPRSYKAEQRSTTPYNGTQRRRETRLKTPEPPVISNSKGTLGKTSLSSLLEASVSAKDSVEPPILYPGFKPEILRHCEHALRDLPVEDPRLKMKGRFFFNPKKEETPNEREEKSSNSILLRKGKNKIYWDEEEERHSQITVKSGLHMHQKICQTEEVQIDHKQVQATVTTVDVGVQVYPYDFEQPVKEEKRPIMDRLDWNMRETFDYAPKPREADDLRWSLSNSSQKRAWGRAVSPPRESDSRSLSRERERISSAAYSTRTLTLCTPARNRDEFPAHREPAIRDHYIRDTFPPSYRQNIEDHQDHFLDNRSDHSRGESPMVIDDSPEEIEQESDIFARSTDRSTLGKMQRGQGVNTFKGQVTSRGSRPFRGGRGSFRGKF